MPNDEKLAVISGKLIDLDKYKELREIFKLSHEDAMILAEIEPTQLQDFK